MPKKVLLAPPENIMVQAENLVKIYKSRDVEVMALQGLDLTVERGELMGLVGASGSGKSTLLNMLGGLDRPSAGSLYVDGVDMLKFTEKDFIEYKRRTVGFVWQNNARNLIPYLTAKQNVEMPMLLSGYSGRSQRANELLDMVGLSHRKNSRLDQMSGGEQQRVAIAIALSNNPKLLLADEPTGSVDTATSKLILDVFRELNKAMGVTIIIVTHDTKLSAQIDRVVAIRDGKTSTELVRRQGALKSFGELSDQEQTAHEELTVLDRAGRLQIPKEYLEELGLRGGDKVRVELDETIPAPRLQEYDRVPYGIVESGYVPPLICARVEFHHEYSAGGTRRGRNRNLLFEDIKVRGGGAPIVDIAGYSETAMCRDVTVRGVCVDGRPLLSERDFIWRIGDHCENVVYERAK